MDISLSFSSQSIILIIPITPTILEVLPWARTSLQADKTEEAMHGIDWTREKNIFTQENIGI
jgi:hypothetical protein